MTSARIPPPKELHFREREDGLWEKVKEGEVVGVFRTIDTKPPPWPGDDSSEEEQQAWKREAKRKMALADAPGVEMFFGVGNGPIPTIMFAEPVDE
jgi:hypothetical protein